MPTSKKRRQRIEETLPEWCLRRKGLPYSAKILLYFFLYNINLKGRVTLTRLQEVSGLAYETLRRALMALKLEGIINQELIGSSRHNGYAYVLNFKRLKERTSKNFLEAIKMKDKLILIADHYGLGTQLLKLAEECSEYSAASAKWNVYNRLLSKTGLNRFKEKRDAAAVDCMKELADVLVLARQVGYLMESDPDFKTEIEKLMDAKCDRQIARIAEELQSTQNDKLDLKDTIDFMLSGSLEERMIAEYQQLSIRKNKLGNYLWAIKEGKAPAINQELYKNLWEQFKAMRKYKKLLEEKARLMKIDLKEIHHV